MEDIKEEIDAKDRELTMRKNLLHMMASQCSKALEEVTFQTVDDSTVEILNAKLYDCCSSFNDPHTTFIFIPLRKEEIIQGSADFMSHLKVTYHSIDTASTTKEADVNTWLSQL